MFYTADIEAFNWTKFKTAGLYDGENYLYFTDLDDFLDTLTSKKMRNKKIYFHYGGNYDFKFLLDGLVKRCKTIKIIDSGTRIIQISFSIGKNYAYLIDSFNLLPIAQKKLAAGFGIVHQKTEINFDELDEKEFYSEAMTERLKNDCIGLHEIISKFQTWGLHGGELKLTLASQSLFVFKKKFNSVKLKTLTRESEKFIRQCYFGGRVELFKRHGTNLKYYDVNSLYPFVMLNLMPCGESVITDSYVDGKIGFYHCIVESDLDIGFIGVVRNNKLIFPRGRFFAYVSSADIEQAKKSGVKITVLTGIYFRDAKFLYRDYILELYKIKKNSPPGSLDYTISKLEMNSLYGKHGQRREREEIIFTRDFKKIKAENLLPYYEDLGIYKKQSESKSRDIHPYLAAYVTSLARLHLWRLLKLVGFENVWYSDTDSLVTDVDLSVGDELGELKKEHSIDEGIFLLPKVYSLLCADKNIVRIKGMRGHNIEHQTFSDVLRTGKISKISVEGFRILGYRENLVRTHSLKINRMAVSKTLKATYDKRTLLSDGINTKAIELWEPHLPEN